MQTIVSWSAADRHPLRLWIHPNEISMSDLSITQGDRLVGLEFDEALYPRDAIYGAAYIFLDRCYIHLDRPSSGRILVQLRLKPSSSFPLEELAGEFENELLGQAWRRQILEENRALIERISARAAAGSAGPPGLDDLLNVDASGEAFEDPLGIAMSWEEKYKKKKPEDGARGQDEPQAAAPEGVSKDSAPEGSPVGGGEGGAP
jgi:His-Xaa-Ser system protein HxsD